MQRLERAVVDLMEALRSPPRFHQSWRHLVRQRVEVVHEALADERAAAEGNLDARATYLCRERDRLLDRLGALRTSLAEATELEPVRAGLQRLAVDLTHHQQRVNDLAYDAVAMEVGGSE